MSCLRVERWGWQSRGIVAAHTSKSTCVLTLKKESPVFSNEPPAQGGSYSKEGCFWDEMVGIPVLIIE